MLNCLLWSKEQRATVHHRILQATAPTSRPSEKEIFCLLGGFFHLRNDGRKELSTFDVHRRRTGVDSKKKKKKKTSGKRDHPALFGFWDKDQRLGRGVAPWVIETNDDPSIVV